MNLHSPILLGILLSSFVTGLVIFFLKEESHRLRTWLNLFGAGVKLILVAVLLSGVYHGETYTFAVEFLPGIPFALGADANAMLFVTLSSVLWFWTTIYAVGYLEHSPSQPLLRLFQPVRHGDHRYRHVGQPGHLPHVL